MSLEVFKADVRLPIFIGRYCRPIFLVREKSADKACHTTQRMARAPNVNMADWSSDEENAAVAVFAVLLRRKRRRRQRNVWARCWIMKRLVLTTLLHNDLPFELNTCK